MDEGSITDFERASNNREGGATFDFSLPVFLLANVPFPGLWAFAVLFLVVIQLPSLLVIFPVIIYPFSANEPLPAVLWTIALLVIALSEAPSAGLSSPA